MKNLFYLFAIAGLVLGSCQAKYTIAKRKYNKGFYIAKNHSKNNTSTSDQNDRTDSKLAKNVKIEPVYITKQEQLSTGNQENTVITQNESVVAVKNTTKKVKSSTKQQTETLTASSSKTPSYENTSNKTYKPVNLQNQKSKKSDDGKLVLLVILSLFPILALIAIYIHDGKSITLNFWIDLLLHFIFLYWLFAILVVLDVVNLA